MINNMHIKQNKKQTELHNILNEMWKAEIFNVGFVRTHSTDLFKTK